MTRERRTAPAPRRTVWREVPERRSGVTVEAVTFEDLGTPGVGVVVVIGRDQHDAEHAVVLVAPTGVWAALGRELLHRASRDDWSKPKERP